MIPKALGYAAAGAGLCFVGYCIYFDHKRRNDPLFKQKLREKRKKAEQSSKKRTTAGLIQVSDLKNAQIMQQFFFQEIQLGEDLLGSGDYYSCVEHLANAVAVCGTPDKLLEVLSQTLTPQVFQMLIQSVPVAQQRIATVAGAALAGGPMGGPPGAGGPSPVLGMAEEDLE